MIHLYLIYEVIILLRTMCSFKALKYKGKRVIIYVIICGNIKYGYDTIGRLVRTLFC